MGDFTPTQKHFALLGASGYVAPRHMRAILETGQKLLAAYDPFDSVGIIDRYFPEADFFTEFERFDRHIEKLRRRGTKTDFVSVCSPNYLHDAHCRFGMRAGTDVICEKPLVLNPWNLDALQEIEQETGKCIFPILQLRYHPTVVALKDHVDNASKGDIFDITLTYLTSRGKWYHASWKGNQSMSGGIATNIGIHFFDILLWIFGNVRDNIVYQHSHDRASGYLILDRARIKWFLSIDGSIRVDKGHAQIAPPYRSLMLGDEQFDFTEGFENLHTRSYEKILRREGFSLADSRPAIQLAHDIRNATLHQTDQNTHPLADNVKRKHPFDR